MKNNNFIHKCTVKGCNKYRLHGDLLFCPDCRDKWRAIIRMNGIEEKIILPTEEYRLVRHFQNVSKGLIY